MASDILSRRFEFSIPMRDLAVWRIKLLEYFCESMMFTKKILTIIILTFGFLSMTVTQVLEIQKERQKIVEIHEFGSNVVGFFHW